MGNHDVLDVLYAARILHATTGVIATSDCEQIESRSPYPYHVSSYKHFTDKFEEFLKEVFPNFYVGDGLAHDTVDEIRGTFGGSLVFSARWVENPYSIRKQLRFSVGYNSKANLDPITLFGGKVSNGRKLTDAEKEDLFGIMVEGEYSTKIEDIAYALLQIGVLQGNSLESLDLDDARDYLISCEPDKKEG